MPSENRQKCPEVSKFIAYITGQSLARQVKLHLDLGPWWWYSGQRSGLLLQQSEFVSCLLLNFSVIVLYEKTKIKEEEAGHGPFLKKLHLDFI